MLKFCWEGLALRLRLLQPHARPSNLPHCCCSPAPSASSATAPSAIQRQWQWHPLAAPRQQQWQATPALDRALPPPLKS